MAEKIEFEVLSAATNAVVARHPDRNFPGILIQGDSLKTMLDEIEELGDEFQAGDREAVSGIIDRLRDRFVDLLAHYETVLAAEGAQLPYTKTVRR